MQIEEIKKIKNQIYQIAAKHGISKVYVFGSVARGESMNSSDVDFLVELNTGASVLGVGGFQYEVQQLLGIDIDVVPTFALDKIEDQTFVKAIQAEAIAL